MRAQPVGVEPRLVAVGEDRVDGLVRAADRSERDIVGNRDRVEQALAARVAALGAEAVVAQPDGVEPTRGAVGPAEAQRAVGGESGVRDHDKV